MPGSTGPAIEKPRVGIYLGVTEHGNVETENEIYLLKGYDYDTSYWSHHHNPRTVANNPAGEVALNAGITGPHYTIGAACAAGNAGLIQGAQMLRLGDCDLALAGGVSESIHTFGIFASFKSQGALADARRPDQGLAPLRHGPQRHRRRRRGLRVRPGAAGSTPAAAGRRSMASWPAMRSTPTRPTLSCPIPSGRPSASSWRSAGRACAPDQIDIVSTHATGTGQGDTQECAALRQVFAGSTKTYFNNTKSFIGHAMGAAGALELAGNLPAFDDGVCHATINVDELDPECALTTLVLNEPRQIGPVQYLLNNSFGMLGINSVVIIKKHL